MRLSLSLSTAGPCPSMEEFYSTLSTTFHWPQTDYGEMASFQCPCDAFPELTKDLFATRICGAGGQWMEAKVADCTHAFDSLDAYCKVCIDEQTSHDICIVNLAEASSFYLPIYTGTLCVCSPP